MGFRMNATTLAQVREQSPEWQLLCHCARPSVAAADDGALERLLEAPLHGERFLALARRHRLLPLAAAHLEPCLARLPDSVASRLASVVAANVGRNRMLVEALVELAERLTAAGVRHLPYKGPALAALCYPSPDLRQSDDLDFLVAPADIRRAIDAVLALGRYHPYGPSAAGRDWRGQSERDGMVFVEQSGRFWVDLATAAGAPQLGVRLDDAQVWQTAVTVALEGGRVRTLSPRVYALALAAHGSKHLWRRLAWVTDMAAVLGPLSALEREAVWGEAERCHGTRVLSLAVRLVESQLSLPLAGLPPPGSACWSGVTGVMARIGAPDGPPLRTPALRRIVRVHLSLQERWRDKLRYLLKLVFVPTHPDRRTLPLPASWSWLHVPLRPFLYVWRHTCGRARSGATEATYQPGGPGAPPSLASAALLTLLAEGRACRLEATGLSMRPLIRAGDLLTLVPVAFEAVRVGDVVVCNTGKDNALLIHRVIRKEALRLQLRGDNRRDADGWFGAASVVARVAAVQRAGRRVRCGLGAERALLGRLGRAGPVALWLCPWRRL